MRNLYVRCAICGEWVESREVAIFEPFIVCKKCYRGD